jgi:hypothetical protein
MENKVIQIEPKAATKM